MILMTIIAIIFAVLLCLASYSFIMLIWRFIGLIEEAYNIMTRKELKS
jgi:hypothetical protein